MGWYYDLYTPDLKLREDGKFVACSDVFFNDKIGDDIPFIGNYIMGLGGKYLDFTDGIYILNEELCKKADEVSESTFFTDFLKEYDCSGMLIKIS